MRTVYDDLIQQKQKEMSKTLEDMTYKYINPQTQQPTKVPASHFEKELGLEVERVINQAVNQKFLTIMYTELNSLMKDNKELFYKALLCIDNNLNPKDLRISDQIALNHTYAYMEEKQANERKNFRFFSEDISNEYKKAITDPNIQATAMEVSNFIENNETRDLNAIKNQGDNTYNQQQDNNYDEYEEEPDLDF